MRAPVIKDFLSVSGLAQKGHECVLNKNNLRIICKDGTIVPIYFFDNLFYMPCLVPTTDESEFSGGTAPHFADEDGCSSPHLHATKCTTMMKIMFPKRQSCASP